MFSADLPGWARGVVFGPGWRVRRFDAFGCRVALATARPKPLMVSRTTIEYPLSSGPFDKSYGQDATSAALASKLLRGSFAMCLSLTHARRETMPKERVR